MYVYIYLYYILYIYIYIHMHTYTHIHMHTRIQAVKACIMYAAVRNVVWQDCDTICMHRSSH